MGEPTTDVNNGLPITETTYFILLSLAPGPSVGGRSSPSAATKCRCYNEGLSAARVEECNGIDDDCNDEEFVHEGIDDVYDTSTCACVGALPAITAVRAQASLTAAVGLKLPY